MRKVVGGSPNDITTGGRAKTQEMNRKLTIFDMV